MSPWRGKTNKFESEDLGGCLADGRTVRGHRLEALKMLVSDAATAEKCLDSAFKEETKAIMVNDVAIAFFEAPVEKGDCSRAA